MKQFIIAVGALALVSLFLMLLWNWLMPGLFHLVQIGYWKAVGLYLLGSCLFGSRPQVD